MRMRNKGVVVAGACLALLILFSTVAAADDFRAGYELGVEQGKKDAPIINVIWGLLGGPIAFGVAAFSSPPDPWRRVSSSSTASQTTTRPATSRGTVRGAS